MQQLDPITLAGIFQGMIDTSTQIYFIYDLEQKIFRTLCAAFDDIWELDRHTINDNQNQLLEAIHEYDLGYLEGLYGQLKNGKKKRTGDVEFRITTNNDKEKHLSVNVFYIEEGASHYLVGFVDDITERKNNEKLAFKIGAGKNATLEILAHDLTSPLGNVKLITDILKDELSEASEKTIKLLNMVAKASEHAIDLISTYVNQEFLETSEVSLMTERVNLSRKIEELFNMYKQQEYSLDKTFTLNKSIDDFFVDVDELKFMQVLNNLISNAIKFTPDHGRITVTLEERQNHFVVTIADNGIGIPRELHPYVFDKFTRARRKGLKGERPVGLGMSIVKLIVELHGGEITFESKEGEGSTFFIKVPLSPLEMLSDA